MNAAQVMVRLGMQPKQRMRTAPTDGARYSHEMRVATATTE